MPFRLLFLSLLVHLCVCAAPISNTQMRVEVMAAQLVQEAKTLDLDGDIVIFYGDVVLLADRAHYNAESFILELSGHVAMIRDMAYASLGERMEVDLKKDRAEMKSLFIMDYNSELWLRGKEAVRNKDLLTLSHALVSSCDIECPDWYLKFSSLDFNSTRQWMNVYNPVIYMADVPVLYFPYLGFSTNHKRRTGLLRPDIGVSSRDGIFYAQPVFIAPDPQWDLQITPQIRFSRGKGIYGDFRFVDTPHSRGEIKSGFFHSKRSFIDQYNLKNSSHYGFEVRYDSSSIFADEAGDNHDGVYVDITYLNDPDYLNLQARSASELANSSQVLSRFNYYYNTPQNYVGVYGKYFIDTSLSSNKDTVQSLPIVQLHHYQNRLFGWDALNYFADYRLTNFFSGTGKNIQMQELNAPLIFYTDFFDEYLKLSISENLYYAYAGYHNMPKSAEGNYYQMFRNYHKIDIYSDLAKKYGSVFHTMQLRVTYNKPSFSSENGYMDPSVSILRSPSENMTLSSINYFYNDSDEFFYYRIAQPILYEKSDHRYADLEQEVRYRFLKNYELYTDLFYSYYQKGVTAATSHIKYSDLVYDIMLTHFYKTLNSSTTSDFFTLNATYRSESANDWYGEVAYDNLDSKMNRWGVGVHLFRHCWDLNLGIKDERRPILTSAGAQSVDNLVFYFQINLVPLGGFEHTYEQEF
ncbi:LPS-assembly protein LptD [Hydrogenimonas sp.]